MSCFILALLLSGSVASAQEAGEPFEPPLSGRPARFNGAVGIFRISTEAEPVSVQVEKPVRLTIRITSSGKVQTPPTQPNLANDPLFAEQFHIQAVDSQETPPKNTWEFHYILKPRSVKVKEVPEIALCYFDLSFGADARGYQTTYSEAIPLTVTPAPSDVPKVEGSAPAAIPEHLLELERGEHVLRRDSSWQLPATPILILLLLAPPGGCAALFLLWRHFHPDSARQVYRRRSRAARQALKDLNRAMNAEDVVETAARYLHARFGLVSATPTPAEVATHLEKVNASARIQRAGSELFAACDAVRYAPATTNGDLREMASAFILAVEAET